MIVASLVAAWILLLFKIAVGTLVSVTFIGCVVWGISSRKSDARPK